MEKLTNFIEYGQNIFIHKSCQLDSDVRIDPFVTIGPNVVIGKGSKISSHVVIGTEAEMPGEDEKKDFTVLIGQNVVIREFVTIHSGYTRDTIIEDGVYIMNHSHIAHDCWVKKNATIAASVTLAGTVKIGEECFIGIESSVHQGAIIGDLTILGANSFAKGALGPCLKYVGNPATPISINDFAIKKSQKNKLDLNLLIEDAKKILDGK
jgi:UDP-N-acetylglucosamine acyltransferase